MGIDSTDGNRLHQPAKNLKLSCSKIAIKDFVGVSISHEREKSSLCSEYLNMRRRISSTFTQDVNSTKPNRAPLERCPLIPQIEAAFLPIRGDSREFLHRIKKHRH